MKKNLNQESKESAKGYLLGNINKQKVETTSVETRSLAYFPFSEIASSNQPLYDPEDFFMYSVSVSVNTHVKSDLSNIDDNYSNSEIDLYKVITKDKLSKTFFRGLKYIEDEIYSLSYGATFLDETEDKELWVISEKVYQDLLNSGIIPDDFSLEKINENEKYILVNFLYILDDNKDEFRVIQLAKDKFISSASDVKRLEKWKQDQNKS